MIRLTVDIQDRIAKINGPFDSTAFPCRNIGIMVKYVFYFVYNNVERKLEHVLNACSEE